MAVVSTASTPSPTFSSAPGKRHPHAGRWPRTARLVWRERIEVNENGESMFVWDEVWTKPSRKFGRAKAGRLRQVASIPSIAPHFPSLIKFNPLNGVLTLSRPADEFGPCISGGDDDQKQQLARLDALSLRRVKRELMAVYSALYDNAIAYLFSPDGFQVVRRGGGGSCGDWTVYIDAWGQASRHKVREPGAKKTAYFAEMEAEQLQKIEAYFAPFESRAKQKISALMNPEIP